MCHGDHEDICQSTSYKLPSLRFVSKNSRLHNLETKKYDSETNSYIEDEALGNSDMEFYCPNCSGKLDPEGIVL